MLFIYHVLYFLKTFPVFVSTRSAFVYSVVMGICNTLVIKLIVLNFSTFFFFLNFEALTYLGLQSVQFHLAATPSFLF